MPRALVILILAIIAAAARADDVPELPELPESPELSELSELSDLSDLSDNAAASDKAAVSDSLAASLPYFLNGRRPTLYDFPYSRTLSRPDWTKLWVNTGVLVGGAVATLVILESLPDGATAWSRAERRKTPLFRRWLNHVKAGPVWDHDKFIFNYVLHPYGGAAYYMSARSSGFNCWGSFLYGFAISTLFWEYGFEAFNEIPSVQDLVITPVVGAVMGECFYRAKRSIVSHGYELLGSPVLGYIAAFFLDPVNEVTGYFRKEQYRIHRGYEERHRADEPSLSSGFWVNPGGLNPGAGVRLTYNF